MSITEFLLARIDEDEAAADAAVRYGDQWAWGSPERVLAECEAKRRIVGMASEWVELGASMGATPRENERAIVAEQACRHLAGVYADYPDYDPAWRM